MVCAMIWYNESELLWDKEAKTPVEQRTEAQVENDPKTHVGQRAKVPVA